MLKTNLINTLALLPIIGLIIHPQVSLSQNKPDATPKIDQVISQSFSEKELGQQLLQELIQCLGNKIPNAQQPSQGELEAVSMQCSMEVIILTPNGTIRPDFHDRMKALITVTGMDIPRTTSTGKGQVQISQVPNSLLFTVPVNMAGEKYDFILDTGASNSIINQPLATKLNLTGVKIPGELLEYFVVGNNCDDMEATLHSLPPVKVDQAQVTGLNSMGLPASFIPANIPGVLGMDFLKSFDLVVNPDQDKLELLSPSRPNTSDIQLQGTLGVMTTQVKINGQGPFTFLLDTGADLVVLSAKTANKLGIDLNQANNVDVQGFCGVEVGKTIKLDRLSLGKYEQSGLEGVALENNIFDLLGIDGIVGQNFLVNYRQHWRFGPVNELDFPENGSLQLTPIR